MLTKKQIAELKSIRDGNPNYGCNVTNTRVAHALAKKKLVTLFEQSEHIRGERRHHWCEFRINSTGRAALIADQRQPEGEVMRDTETLDRLYLEWSQFTRARTKREIDMLAALRAAANWFTPPNDSRTPFPLKQVADAIAKAEPEAK